MSELDKFISRVKQLDSQDAKETSFDVKFLVKVVNKTFRGGFHCCRSKNVEKLPCPCGLGLKQKQKPSRR